jgi:hypothetical protein
VEFLERHGGLAQPEDLIEQLGRGQGGRVGRRLDLRDQFGGAERRLGQARLTPAFRVPEFPQLEAVQGRRGIGRIKMPPVRYSSRASRFQVDSSSFHCRA